MKGELTMSLDENDYRKINSALSQLSEIEKDAVVNRGLQEGVRVFVRAGKSNYKATKSRDAHNVNMANYMATKRGGSLEKAFSTKVKKKKGKGYAGFTKYGHHAHLCDAGTEKRWTSKGAYRGSVSKNAPKTGSRFWHNAFESKKNVAAQELMDSIRISINKILNRNR